MIQRVKINSSEIVIKNADGNEIFNTANLYLKTDPNGQIKVGGYGSCPTVFGNGSVTDQNLGWYPCGLVTNGQESAFRSQGWTVVVPACTAIKLQLSPATANGIIGGAYSPQMTAQFNGQPATTFNWSLHYQGFWTVGIVNHQPTPSTSPGTWYYPPPTQDYSQWSSYTAAGYDSETGQIVTYTQYLVNVIPSMPINTVAWSGQCLMTLRDPVTLSLAVTP